MEKEEEDFLGAPVEYKVWISVLNLSSLPGKNNYFVYTICEKYCKNKWQNMNSFFSVLSSTVWRIKTARAASEKQVILFFVNK